VCFEPQARPPAPPRTGAGAATERLTLSAADGNTFAATLAATAREGAPGLVVLPDVRGLHPYYEALAEAFAGAGVHALAVDLYGRTAGAKRREDEFEWQEHRAAARDATIALDVRAALEELERRGVERRFVLGFCFGGRAAFMQGSQPGVAGVIGFYGAPGRAEDGGSSPLEEARAGRLRAPVLALYGGADEKITREEQQAFAEALTAAHVLHETVVYEGAPHSFFDRTMDEHAAACDDAWRLMLRFFGIPAI
jgi:carboxymethylenebutenolidase